MRRPAACRGSLTRPLKPSKLILVEGVPGSGKTTMATTVHHGPYEQIAAAYHTLTGWISEHGHDIAGPPREIYLNDPQTVAPAEILTRVEFPICSEDN